jgi:membrane associated rhomboid family serine protease
MQAGFGIIVGKSVTHFAMPATTYISLLLILINVAVSYKGFKDKNFLQQYTFDVERVKLYREYYRLLTAGFLHVGWLHLIINMFSLYFFSGAVEAALGSLGFVVIYFTSLVGGNLLTLYINRHRDDYSAVGASGAVSGIIFASIALFPGIRIGMFPLPISLPAWVYGLAYVLYSIYSIGARRDNVGHEAHLGGALVGLVIALMFEPSALLENYPVILLLALPCIVFIYLIATRPHLLLLGGFFTKRKKPSLTADQRYNAGKAAEQKEIDAILEKIHRKGMASLSRTERDKLEHYSKQGH